MNRRIVLIVVLCGLFLSGGWIFAVGLELSAGQNVEIKSGDNWVSATFEKKEGRKFQVKTEDGTEQWVAADHIRLPGMSNSVAAGTATAVTNITLLQPTSPPHRANGGLNIRPTTRASNTFLDLTPTAGTSVGNPAFLQGCADTPWVIVAAGKENGDEITLLCANVDEPSKTEERTLTAHSQHIMTAAASGNVLITQDNGDSQLLHSWEYKDGQYQLKANYSFTFSGNAKRPSWCRLLSSTHLLVHFDPTENHLIDLASKHQIAFLKSGNLSMNESGQFLYGTVDSGGVIMRPADLAIVMQICDAKTTLAVDPTGTYAAIISAKNIDVVKLGSNKPMGHYPGMNTFNRGFTLLGAGEVLVNGSVYYDLKTGIPVWNYKAPETSSVYLANGQRLYVGSAGGQIGVLAVMLPDAAATAALKDATPDKFVLSPGAKISVDGDLGIFGDGEQAKKNLTESLAASGHKLDDNSTDYKLTITSAAGETKHMSFREFGHFGPPQVHEVDAPSTDVHMVLTHASETIWKKDMHFGGGGVAMLPEGKTLEQTLSDQSHPNAGALKGLDLPSYLVKAADGAKISTLGESELTRSGFANP